MVQRGLLFFFVTLLVTQLFSPVFAHTTIGNLSNTPPYFRHNDHELNPNNTFGTAHVPGPLAYLWPGSGFNFYTNTSGPPGYQSPFQDFEQPLQVAGNSYSPEGAILTSTPDQDNIGDFILAINFSQPRAFISDENPTPTFRYNNITIYIPAPLVDKGGELIQDGFEPAGSIIWDLGDSSNILTTLTADNGQIFVGKADTNDPFAPGWWAIQILASGSGIEFTPGREWKEHYYIRINQLRAPDIAGRYLFKIFLGGHYPVKKQGNPLVNSTMPVENWPVLLVKAELDPAIIYGTLRYGEFASPVLYGEPIRVPGMIRAVGTAIDPITNEPTNRRVEARGYFNGSSGGHFEIEGVAPGIYDIFASAAGFPEQLVSNSIMVIRGQSLLSDFYLNPGPEIRGEIYSKNCSGRTPWKSELPISVVIYDSDNYVEQNVESYSPINLTHAPYTSYVIGNTIFDSDKLAPPNAPKQVAFPWEGPISYYPNTAIPPFIDPFGVHNGVGPSQVWWVSPTANFDPITGLGSDSSSFRFQFGYQRHYGAPRKMSGMVPQTFATWIDGIGPGTYFIRAYINGYIQTDISGAIFQDYPITIVDRQTLSEDLFIDLWISGTLNFTVYFHDSVAGLQTQPIGGPDPGRFLLAEAVDSSGELVSFNFTYVPSSSRSATLTLNGLGMTGVIPPPDPRSGVKYSLFRYRGVRDYGIYPGTYLLHIYMRGYIHAIPPGEESSNLDQPAAFSISSCERLSSLSTHMFRGAGINTTIYSIDCQDPPSATPWKWNDTSASILVYDLASGEQIDAIYYWDSIRNIWTIPRTNSDYTSIPWPNWKTVFGSSSSFLITNGSTILERFGPDLPSPISLFPEQDIASNVFFQSSFRIGFLYTSFFYRAPDFESTLAIYPGQYALSSWTYGYVQEGVTTLGELGTHLVSVRIGHIADTSVRLIEGVEFNLKIVFEKEGLPTSLPANMSMRIRIYDDRDVLVAAASTSHDFGEVDPSSDVGFFADGKKIFDAGGTKPPIPAGTLQVEYKRLTGLFGYVDPIEGTEALRRLFQFSPNVGVWGDSSTSIIGAYKGNWHVLVELVPWYSPSEFYPPTPGLLQGEVHQTKFTILLPYNHLGPFELRHDVIIPNANLCGGATAALSLDLRGIVIGAVYARNMRGDFRTVSWANILFETPTQTYQTYSFDGFYESYLPQNIYTIKVEEPGLSHQDERIMLSDAATITSEVYMSQTGVPIPEFSIHASTVLTIYLCISYLLASKRTKVKKKPISEK
jgi:hypothetical protein